MEEITRWRWKMKLDERERWKREDGRELGGRGGVGGGR